MKPIACLALAVTCLSALFAVSAQDAADDQIDEVSREATRLEAELGKFKDTAPEAADAMFQLVELYHRHGRVFGLIRVAQLFAASHIGDPRHRDVMFKLLDGHQSASRDVDFVATCRQWLDRYPKDAAALGIKVRLAATLDQQNDRGASGDAHREVYRQQPNTPLGRHHAVIAIQQYASVNNKLVYSRAAELAELLFDAVPAGPYAEEIGWQGVAQWRRGNEWAKSNAIALRILKKGLPTLPARKRQLRMMMGENYGRLGQWANATDSYTAARAAADRQDAHYQVIQAMYNNEAIKPAGMAPIVNDYVRKYPLRPDRFDRLGLLALKYERAADKASASRLFAGLLPVAARAHNAASAYLRTRGTEPAVHAESLRVLNDAITRNPNPGDQGYLRFVLAFELYRDRLKQPAQTRAVLRQLVSLSPTNDSYSQTALHWLLYNAANDAEFNAEVQRYLASRLKVLQYTSFRGYLAGWIQTARRQKDHKNRAASAKTLLAQADKHPLVVAWIASEPNSKKGDNAREALLVSKHYAGLSPDMVRSLLSRHGYYLRHHTPGNQRSRSGSAYGKLAQRFPKDYPAAVTWLQAATDYGPAEVAREAALHLLSLVPTSSNADEFRRLMNAADMNKDAVLALRIHGWIVAAEKQHGPVIGYAYQIGDVLAKYKHNPQAVAYWRSHVPVDRHHYDSMYCASRVLATLEPPQQIPFLQELLKHESNYHGNYAGWIADRYLRLEKPDLVNFEKVMRASRTRQDARPLRSWGLDESLVQAWVDRLRGDKEATEADKRLVFTLVRDLKFHRPSAAGALALLELPDPKPRPEMDRLLVYQAVTGQVGDGTTDWDRLMPYVQAALSRKDYVAAATLAGSMLAHIPSIDQGRRKTARDLVAQSYSRMGAVGLTIDENSPIAPLLQAALSLRLGDERLAFENYTANRALFDQHRDEVPADLIEFICQNHIAAGGDENHDRVEDILRGWMVRHSESNQFDNQTKARMQLLLARNFAKAQRFDIARSEYTTVKNRYPKTAQAIEAEFGIGETFLAQKVYDQAELVFEKLANSRELDIVVRAEFLRGVLAHRRGDRDEARVIFRGVLDRVPSIDLANRALFNLAEVYGDEERYIDQLNLLRTVGRLGRRSKRTHTPGIDLSIVVQDSDLGISRGHNKIPVIVTTVPGGDRELVYLVSGGAGKGLFRVDLPTELGPVAKNDRVLQVTGKDTIHCDYPEEFKQEFKRVPLSDVDIRIAADAEFKVASSRIIDQEKETFSQRLEREAREATDADRRVSQRRPANQVKPGNQIYFRVKDADRDLSDEFDTIVVKLSAESGDQVQATLKETSPHSGVFEGTAATGELPAGALASDTAIEHNPLMAIDRDFDTFWMSEPDGATPKWLTIDMKDLKLVARVRISSPDTDRNTPVRGILYGSNDGRYWVRMAGNPPQQSAAPVAGESGPMTARLYAGNHTGYSDWNQVVSLTKNSKAFDESEVEALSWKRPEDADDPKAATAPFTAVWHGKLVQEREGAARIVVAGGRTAVAIDGRLELPLGTGNRTVDVWLEQGTHDLTIFAATTNGQQGVSASIARADHNAAGVTMISFRKQDFDLDQTFARPALEREQVQADFGDGEWTMQFEPRELRYVRFEVQEYRGEALAINNVEIVGEEAGQVYIPTKADVLALSKNSVLEIAGGDIVTVTYTDEFTQRENASSRLLTARLTATYYNGSVVPIDFDFVRQGSGAISELRKRVIRVDPGDKFIVEIVDYDRDQSEKQDTVRFDVFKNDGEPVEFTATETDQYSGVFTKEIFTGAQAGEKIDFVVNPGDRLYVRYIDSQNTFPGHAVPRETVVFVNQPTEGQVRILETRVIPPPADSQASPRIDFVTPDDPEAISRVAFEAPLTIEVIDPDQAKDSRSTVTVMLQTTDGATVKVNCVISTAHSTLPPGAGALYALEEGRFVGQVILQLGSKASPALVPVTADMPRSLIGGPVIVEEGEEEGDETLLNQGLVTRVLNLTGKDQVLGAYRDEQRPDGTPSLLSAKARLISNGNLACLDRDYDKPVKQLHVGEKLFLRVNDADQDVSDERDQVTVEITTEFGEKESILLEETLVHSGVFAGSLTLKSNDKPQPGNLDAANPVVECYFGDTLHLKYVDTTATTENGRLERMLDVPVVIGTDGLVAAFSKTFNDEQLAVETKFHIAESYFELFKSHKKLKRDDEQTADLEAGRRVLREVMEDYPDPRYVPRIGYLLGQFAQELEQWNEAIDSYEMIVRQYPEHTLAADAQYKLAQCYELSGDFEQALEAYVTLAATYPKNPLIANVMIRICDHFYKQETYDIAAQVGEKFLEKFAGHEHAALIAYRIGQCHYKAEEFVVASESFDRFAKRFPDDGRAAFAVFWSGESFWKAKNNREAFRRYNKCRWDFPASEAAKYARGRLALPELLQQFEAEAQSLENENP